MKKFILKNTLAGIAATLAVVIFGYLAVQYFGRYIMFAIGAGMFGLGAAVHRNQKSVPQQSLRERRVVAEIQPQLTLSENKVKKLDNTAKNHSYNAISGNSITDTPKFVRHRVNITRIASTSQSYGYCRKRLALCHKAKVESSTQTIASK